MTTATLTLTEFLLARIAEDEAGARVIPREWWSRRVLAECEAKRRIVEMFAEEQTRARIYNKGYDDGILNDNDLGDRARSNSRARGLEEAALALAAVYSDHPDFQEDWRA